MYMYSGMRSAGIMYGSHSHSISHWLYIQIGKDTGNGVSGKEGKGERGRGRERKRDRKERQTEREGKGGTTICGNVPSMRSRTMKRSSWSWNVNQRLTRKVCSSCLNISLSRSTFSTACLWMICTLFMYFIAYISFVSFFLTMHTYKEVMETWVGMDLATMNHELTFPNAPFPIALNIWKWLKSTKGSEKVMGYKAAIYCTRWLLDY